MNRGVVVGLKDRYMVVLAGGDFVRIAGRSDVNTGDEIVFDNEEIVNNKKRSWNMPRACLAGLAAAVVMFSFLLPSLQPANHAYAIAVVDINPSIELFLNQDGEVTEFAALNEDGEELGELDLVGLEVGKALETIIQEAERQGYIDYLDATNVLVTTIPLGGNEEANDNIKEDLLDDLSDSRALRNVNLAILNLFEEAYRKAKKEKKPVGLTALPDNQDLKYGTVREYFNDASNVVLFEKEGAFIHSVNQELWNLVNGLEQLAEEEGLDLNFGEIRSCLRGGETEMSEIMDRVQKMLERNRKIVRGRKESLMAREEKLKQATNKLEDIQVKAESGNLNPGNKNGEEPSPSATDTEVEADDAHQVDTEPEQNAKEVSKDVKDKDKEA